ncbi:molybdopterin molybdotransferase MoeA [Archaeoglobus neptunius]|uniref:molybdopterin molybdotransferase MoeA n=1 Tax=Archaeoglobus neptunius TaxID=2798580 RepID=UPI001925E341|nr:molybdopterin molybdotransferase MoeA [Archaeoglobus neptunius]
MRELVTIDETARIVEELRSRYYYRRDTELVRVEDAAGRELAEDVKSPLDLPQFDIATMDGYAVKFGRRKYRVVGEIYAGDLNDYRAGDDECYYITTGARMPLNTDTVVKVEITAEKNGIMVITGNVDRGKYVLKRGSEIRARDIILSKNVVLNPQEIAALKSAGVDHVRVYRRLRAAVFSNGDEIKKGIIRDSNSAMIMAFLRKWGCKVEFLGTAGDDESEVREMIERGVEDYDVVLTSGGVSVGKKDYIIRVLSKMGDLLLYRVRQRPGKPMVVAVVKEKPVFALPGKPAGAFTAMLSLRRYFLGNRPFPKVRAKIAADVILPTRGFSYYLFVKIENGYAFPAGFRHSHVSIIPDDRYEVSLVSAMSRSTLSDGFVVTDRDLKKGEEVEVNLYD